LIEQLFKSSLILSVLSLDFSTIAYWLASSLLSITAFSHRVDILAYFWIFHYYCGVCGSPGRQRVRLLDVAGRSCRECSRLETVRIAQTGDLPVLYVRKTVTMCSRFGVSGQFDW
jgi:hypothetical protein